MTSTSSGNDDFGAGLDEQAAVERPDVCDVDLSCGVDVASAGFNPALRRAPSVDAINVPLAPNAGFVPSWKPRRIPVKCIGLTLPEGQMFQPPEEANETSSDGFELKAITPPKREKPAADDQKRTRIKPPKDALSLQDRLFYLLQPPLESYCCCEQGR